MDITGVRVDHVRTGDNLAYPLMKGLTREKTYKSSKGMGLIKVHRVMNRL